MYIYIHIHICLRTVWGSHSLGYAQSWLRAVLVAHNQDCAKPRHCAKPGASRGLTWPPVEDGTDVLYIVYRISLIRKT